MAAGPDRRTWTLALSVLLVGALAWPRAVYGASSRFMTERRELSRLLIAIDKRAPAESVLVAAHGHEFMATYVLGRQASSHRTNITSPAARVGWIVRDSNARCRMSGVDLARTDHLVFEEETALLKRRSSSPETWNCLRLDNPHLALLDLNTGSPGGTTCDRARWASSCK